MKYWLRWLREGMEKMIIAEIGDAPHPNGKVLRLWTAAGRRVCSRGVPPESGMQSLQECCGLFSEEDAQYYAALADVAIRIPNLTQWLREWLGSCLDRVRAAMSR